MEDALTRKEQREAAKKKVKALGVKMTTSLSLLSQRNEGLQVLRYILHESCFLAPLTYETAEGVNRDVMIINEAKRRMYLALRAHMDRATVLRVELPEQGDITKGEPWEELT